jgi:uncharacterized protein (TIGR03067 family)
MHRLTPLLVLVAASLAAGFAPAPAPRPKPLHPELERIQGQWEVADWSMEVKEGRRRRGVLEDSVYLGATRGDGTTAEVVGNRLTLRRGGAVRGEWVLRVGPSADLLALEVIEAAGGRPEAMLGIYKVEKGTLTICYREPGKGRPPDFANKEQWLLVLKRGTR